MQEKKQLRKPQNWQGFENLCKKLWGEIWSCPEIKKNGRLGQPQNGVDVYGVPSGENAYYGIQCKGKDEDINAILTTKEIDAEIEKAKGFKPALKKFYFATTANKDVSIEAYIRERDIENRALGSFEVHLFSWDDIVDLIDENKRTHDWFLKSENFKQQYAIQVAFNNDSINLALKVLKTKEIKSYRHYPRPKPELPVHFKNLFRPLPEMADVISRNLGSISAWAGVERNVAKINKSYANFSLKIINTGSVTLWNYKLEIDLSGVGELTFGEVVEHEFPVISFAKHLPFQIKKEQKFKWQILPKNEVLVPGDSITFKSFSVRPINDAGEININWRFLSSEYSESGALTIGYETDFMRDYEEIIIPTDQKERNEEAFFDYLEDKEQTNDE